MRSVLSQHTRNEKWAGKAAEADGRWKKDEATSLGQCSQFSSVLWHSQLSDRKSIRPVKNLNHIFPKVLFQNKLWKKCIITQIHLETAAVKMEDGRWLPLRYKIIKYRSRMYIICHYWKTICKCVDQHINFAQSMTHVERYS